MLDPEGHKPGHDVLNALAGLVEDVRDNRRRNGTRTGPRTYRNRRQFTGRWVGIKPANSSVVFVRPALRKVEKRLCVAE